MDLLPHRIASILPCWEGTPNPAFYVHKVRVNLDINDTVWHMYGSLILSEIPIIFPVHLWKGMKLFSSNICLSLQLIISFLLQRGCPNVVFCVHHFENWPRRKWHSANNDKLVDAAGSSSYLASVSKKVDETHQQQWIPLSTVYHPLSCAGKVPHMWYFVCILRVDIDRIDSMWTIRGL